MDIEYYLANANTGAILVTNQSASVAINIQNPVAQYGNGGLLSYVSIGRSFYQLAAAPNNVFEAKASVLISRFPATVPIGNVLTGTVVTGNWTLQNTPVTVTRYHPFVGCIPIDQNGSLILTVTFDELPNGNVTQVVSNVILGFSKL